MTHSMQRPASRGTFESSQDMFGIQFQYVIDNSSSTQMLLPC